MVPYIQPGRQLTHDDWNGLYGEANAKLVTAYGGLAACLWALRPVPGDPTEPDFTFDRWFFFFDVWVQPCHTIAEQFIADARNSSQIGAWWRKYEHTAFSDYAAQRPLGVQSTYDPRNVIDPAGPVCRLAQLAMYSDEWNSWVQKMWPGAAYGSPYFPSIPGIALLRYSLEAHQRVVDGTAYYVFEDDPLWPAEHMDMWTPVEVVLGRNVGGQFAWPDNWDKYQLFRFHNLQSQAVTITFEVPAGTNQSVTIGPMRSLCVRRTRDPGHLLTSGIAVGWDYFFLHLPGDPWFLNRHAGCNASDPLTAASMIPRALTGPSLDGTKYWDFSPLYANLEYSPGPQEHQLPPGGYFSRPDQESTTLLGDLVYHKGKILAVSPAGQFLIRQTMAMFVDANSEEHTLMMKGNLGIAQGCQDFAVSRLGVDVPAGTSPTQNWKVVTHTDSLGNPIQWDIVFVVRTGGPLHAGDQVNVSFKHKTLDNRWWVDFTGMGSLVQSLAEVGVIVTNPSPAGGYGFQLSLDPTMTLGSGESRDLYGTSTNLFWYALGWFACTVGGDSNAVVEMPAWPPGFSNDLQVLTRDDNAESAVYVSWHYDSGSDSFINDGNVTVNWTNTTLDAGAGASLDAFGPFDTLGAFLTAVRAIGGALTTEISVRLTPFGPGFQVLQSVSFDFPVHSPAYFAVESGALIYADVFFPGNNVWNGDGIWAQLGADGGLEIAWPRFDRAWIDLRSTTHQATEVIGAPGNSGWVQDEEPMVSSYYENSPYAETVRPLVPVFRKTGMAFLSPWITNATALTNNGIGYDAFARFAAWANYLPITIGGVVNDYSAGSALQNSYYGLYRGNVLGNAPTEGDKIGRLALPMSVEQFNAAASVVNGFEGSFNNVFEPPQKSFLFPTCINPVGTGGGRGAGWNLNWGTSGITARIRPRAQYCYWDASDTATTAWWTSMGVPIKTAADFPDPWASFLTTTAKWASLHVEPGVLPRTVDNTWDYTYDGTVFEAWYQYYCAGQTIDQVNATIAGYRWVTITDVQNLCNSLGIPFVFVELAVPATLVLATANPVLLDTLVTNILFFEGGANIQCSAAVWVNDPNGLWVFDPDCGDSDGYHAIRSATVPTDYSSVLVSFGTYLANSVALWDMNFGSALPVTERLYDGEGSPLAATQAVRANRYYLYRRYGGPLATAVCWGRNYAAYTSLYNNTVLRAAAPGQLATSRFNTIPRTAVTGLEGSHEETVLTGNENLITTNYANGLLRIFSGLR